MEGFIHSAQLVEKADVVGRHRSFVCVEDAENTRGQKCVHPKIQNFCILKLKHLVYLI